MTFVAVETQPHISMQRLARQTNATPDYFIVKLSELAQNLQLSSLGLKRRRKQNRNKKSEGRKSSKACDKTQVEVGPQRFHLIRLVLRCILYDSSEDNVLM